MLNASHKFGHRATVALTQVLAIKLSHQSMPFGASASTTCYPCSSQDLDPVSYEGLGNQL